MLLYCPTSTASLVVTGLQCLNLGAAANEMKSPAPYSKFATPKAVAAGPSLSGRNAMLAIYVPAALASVATLALAPAANGREAIVAGMLLLHFTKRVGETLCVHVYSKRAPAAVGGMIGVFYALLVLLITTQQKYVPADVYESEAAHAMLLLGVTLFAVGTVGNLYHHILLANMRRPKTPEPAPVSATPSTSASMASERAPSTSAVASSYSIPTGGLFDVVTMPHYFFELLSWYGIAACAQQVNALLVAAGMTSYLAGRAVATTAWYREQFGDAWPKDRKHLAPFVF